MCDWEQRKLGDVYKERNKRGNDSLKILSVSIHNGVSNEELDSNTLGKEVRRSEDKSLYKHVYFGDLVLNMMRAWQGAVGVVKSEAMVSPAYITAVPSAELYPLFMDYYLRRDEAIGQMNNLSYGVTDFRKRLYWDSFVKVLCHIPTVAEQEKITAFFTHLDDTIALHLCKQHQLEALKQSLIKEILPQNDSVFPRLKFANFNKPWAYHQLKEVLKINSGRDYKHLNEGAIPVYGTGGYMLSVDGKLSNVDGIGLGRKGTIDKPQYLKAPFWTVDTLFYLTPLPNHDIYFLFILTQSINWKCMDESTGVPSLSKAVIEKVTRTFPSLEEQQKIGSFFKQLDEIISHHQQKIDKIQSLKRTLLARMFI